MLNSKLRVVMTVCGLVVAMLSVPGTSFAQCYGCAAPVAVAPTYTTYMPQASFAYMPTPVYRAVYRPAYVTAYQPVYAPGAGWSAGSSYAYTTYRPLFGGWQTRMVPYTTYQPVYTAMPMVAYSGCSTCPSYSACASPCSSGSCGTVTYGTPSSGCASCATQATVVTPAPYSGNGEAAPATNAAPQRTFQEKTEKPATEPELKPIPQSGTRSSSMPAPLLPDPRDRTAVRTVREPARVALIASPSHTAPVQDNDGWRPASE